MLLKTYHLEKFLPLSQNIACSGLYWDNSLFVNIGERANITGLDKFKRLILNEEYEKALLDS